MLKNMGEHKQSIFERLFLMFQTAQKRTECEKEVRRGRFVVIFKGIHNVRGLKNTLKYHFALFKGCMKVVGNLVEAKLVSLLYYGKVYSNPLCWTGDQAEVFMDNIRLHSILVDINVNLSVYLYFSEFS